MKYSLRGNYSHSPRWWSIGVELYRHPTTFSRGRGPEYGGYLYLGPHRWDFNWAQRHTKADIAWLRSLTPTRRLNPETGKLEPLEPLEPGDAYSSVEPTTGES